MTLGRDEIENRFGHHAASLESPIKPHDHASLRIEFMHFVGRLDFLLPDGRCKDLAMTELENASMWAHKALASMNPVEKLPDEYRHPRRLPPPGVNV